MKNSYLLKNEEIEIDLHFIYEICENDSASVQKLIITFQKNIPAVLQKLDNYLVTNNLEQLHNTAHAAKSSLSIIRIDVLYHILAEIENIAKKGEMVNSLSGMIEKAKKLYTGVQQLLETGFKIM